ncbi:DUF4280 domain-containing protein [Anaerosinus massiliensis]|uniref:DUF4280 domain-containing protein n=1 Tax=Massilibacillus massiliensis TaxID=1806837 RepID=UPI000DA621C1|nr:DUF4280 domain-containing protein [Massilibacillus massiliensis]
MSFYRAPHMHPASGAEKSYVVHGAQTSCSNGSGPSLLVVPNSHGVYLKGQAQLNINDCKPNTNILPFGTCKKLKGPCSPGTGPWIGGKEDVLIEGAPALLNTCCNACAIGGMITITDDGQEG